jgi:hypothetical protein
MPLTDVSCRNAKPASSLYKLSDGGGLQLWVQPSGSKLWRVAYRFGGKQKLLSLGSYPLISLADARRIRDDNKRLLAAGQDPAETKKAIKVAQAAVADTFRVVAAEYVAKLKREGRATATTVKIEWLLNFAYPTLGGSPVGAISAPQILSVLRTVEARGKHESVRRLRSSWHPASHGSSRRWKSAGFSRVANSTTMLAGCCSPLRPQGPQ